jgi:hypothetical protein
MFSPQKKLKVIVSFISFGLLSAVAIGLLVIWRDDLAVLSALLGTAAGWVLGTLVSPSGTGEVRQFKEFSKVLSAFLTGFALSKVDHLVSIMPADTFRGPMVIRRVLVGAACFLLAMMVVFVSRRYFPVDDQKDSSNLSKKTRAVLIVNEVSVEPTEAESQA